MTTTAVELDASPVEGVGKFTQRPVGLRFLLGELPLFQVNLPMLRCETHFTQLPAKLPLRIAWDHVPSRVQGVLMRSQPIDGRLPRIAHVHDAIRYVPQQYPRFYADLSQGWEAYLKHFRSAKLKDIRYQVRRFSREGDVRLEDYRRPEQMAEFCHLARTVSKTTYQERLLQSGFPQSAGFEQELTQKAARDEVRGFVLMFNDQPVSYLYCQHLEGLVISQFLGYDPEYNRRSPGTVLLYGMMERLITDGTHRMFDFGQGYSEYKEMFATGSVQCADVYYLRRTMRNRLVVRLHSGMDRVSMGTGWALQRVGLKERLRRLLRKMA